MGHQPPPPMESCSADWSVDRRPRSIPLIGEGWNFGEGGPTARGSCAAQLALGGTRHRAASATGPAMRCAAVDPGHGVRCSNQGVNGLVLRPNGAAAADRTDLMLQSADMVRVGLAGSIRDYLLTRTTAADAWPGPAGLRRPAERLRPPTRRSGELRAFRTTTTRRCSTQRQPSCHRHLARGPGRGTNAGRRGHRLPAKSRVFHAGRDRCAASRWTATASTRATGLTIDWSYATTASAPACRRRATTATTGRDASAAA